MIPSLRVSVATHLQRKSWTKKFCFPWKVVRSHYLSLEAISHYDLISLASTAVNAMKQHFNPSFADKARAGRKLHACTSQVLQTGGKLQPPRGSHKIDKFTPQAADEKPHRILYDFVVLFKWQFVCINGCFAGFFLIHKFQTIKQKVAKYFLLAR